MPPSADPCQERVNTPGVYATTTRSSSPDDRFDLGVEAIVLVSIDGAVAHPLEEVVGRGRAQIDDLAAELWRRLDVFSERESMKRTVQSGSRSVTSNV